MCNGKGTCTTAIFDSKWAVRTANDGILDNTTTTCTSVTAGDITHRRVFPDEEHVCVPNTKFEENVGIRAENGGDIDSAYINYARRVNDCGFWRTSCQH